MDYPYSLILSRTMAYWKIQSPNVVDGFYEFFESENVLGYKLNPHDMVDDNREAKAVLSALTQYIKHAHKGIANKFWEVLHKMNEEIFYYELTMEK